MFYFFLNYIIVVMLNLHINKDGYKNNIISNIWNYDLYIFDLDDTLVKSEYYHHEAWINTLRNNLNDKNFTISYNDFCNTFHSKNPNSIKEYVSELLKINFDEFLSVSKEKNETYLKLLNDSYNQLELIDGVELFLNKIIELNKKFVIVSNSPLSNINFYLERWPILQNASKLYYREMFTQRKPHPECYQMVLADWPELKNKIGFEDSITGIMALIQVPEIMPVFINSETYAHYEEIISLNKNLSVIENYFNLF